MDKFAFFATEYLEKTAERGELSPEQLAAIQAGQQQWFGETGSSAPLPATMSSPGRGAILGGGFGAVLGALPGLFTRSPALAGIGAGLGGAAGAMTAHQMRSEDNEMIEEAIRRGLTHQFDIDAMNGMLGMLGAAHSQQMRGY